MTNNQKIWIASAIAFALCGIAFLSQRQARIKVQEEIGRLQEKIPARPGSSVGEPDRSAEVPPAPPTPPSPPAEELVAMLEDGQSDPADSFLAFAAMLERIRHYSVDDVLALIAELGQLAKSDPGQASKIGFARMMLMVIAAGHAPERILEWSEDTNDEVRSAAFAGLVRKDPHRAHAFLDQSGWPAREVQMGKAALFNEWLGRDVDQALDLFRDGGWYPNPESAAVIADACNDPEIRQRLKEAARDEPDPAVRLQLCKGLALGGLMRGGVGGLREVTAETAIFGAEIRAQLVRDLGGEAMASAPDEAAAWIGAAIRPRDVPEALAAAVGDWARRDFNAAGTWLGTQAPSPARDQAIAGFASTVVDIDPAAAATWANEIADPQLRQRALDQTIARWKLIDPVAAAAWADATAEP